MSDAVRISGADGGFEVTVEGSSTDALALRRLTNQFSFDAPAEPEADVATYRVAAGRIRAVMLAIAPMLARTGIALHRDDATERELTALRHEVGVLGAALKGQLAPADYTLEKRWSKKRELKPTQDAAVRRLLSLPHGADFSVPGAGKTTITLAIHSALRSAGTVKQLLVVCPRNAFRTWEEEIAECFNPPPPVVRLAGGERRVRQILEESAGTDTILLIGYQQLNFCVELVERYLVAPGLHIVLDESHRIKNPRRGAWATACLRIATLAARRDILTGTPAPNATEDLATQLSFLWPFQSVIPEGTFRDENAENLVTERLRPLYVRITKQQLDLPEERITRTFVEMGPLQREIHAQLSRRIAEDMPTKPQGQLARIRLGSMRLLQLASNPALVLSSAEELLLPPLELAADEQLGELFGRYAEFEIPSKFARVVERVAERSAQGKKTLVWSTFVRNLEMLGKLLAKFGPIVVHGAVPTAIDMEDAPDDSREALIERFKTEKSCHVMIANPASCGESVSLHRVCDHAMFIDRSFNAGQFLQAKDRIHRLGLGPNDHVTHELLVSPNTIDQVVDVRLEEKINRLGRLLDDDSLRTLRLDIDEDDEDSATFDLEDAKSVIAFLSQQPAP